MSFYYHPEDTATNCGKQTVARIRVGLCSYFYIYFIGHNRGKKKINNILK